VQQIADLLVGRLRKVAIPLSNRGEDPGSTSTHHLVCDAGQLAAGVWRTHWNGDDDARRTLCADRLNRSLHCRARRQAIVYQQDDAIRELDRRPAGAVVAFPADELGFFLTRDVINDGGGNAELPDDVLVQNADSA